MKRINFRPIFYSFISLGLGIYLARLIFALNIFILITILLSISVLVFICIKYKCIKRLVVILTTFALGVGIFAISITTFTDNSFENKTCTVSGRISEVSSYSGFQSVVLDNTFIDGEKVNKNIVVSISSANTMEMGYVITFTGFLEKTNLFTLNKFNSYYYKYGIAYSSSVKDSDVTVDNFKGLTVSESLRESVKRVLNQNMDSDCASISYASLFGDKTYVNDSIKDNFSISGIAHLLAVSGLHIGFVTSLLLFILNKTKMKRYINVIIISIILAFYCYLCSFSVSVVRASVMFLVLSIASILGKQYDRLNSLGVAGIIVLIYKPLCVFDAGFLLSFGSVFSIFMFSVFFKELFSKCHLPEKLRETFSVMLSTQLGLLPLTVYYYGQMSILTILANLVCIPVFEIFFILLFVLTPIVLIVPIFGVLLKVPAIIIGFIIKIAQIVANQKWAIIDLTRLAPIVLIGIYFAFFIFSHYINFIKSKKVIIGFAVIAFTMVIASGISMPVYYAQNLTVLNSYGTNAYVIELNGVSFCVGDYNKNMIKTTSKYLNNVAYKKANYLITQNAYEVIDSEDFKKIISLSNLELDYNKEYTYDEIKITFFNIQNKKCGTMLEYNNFKVFIGDKNLTFEHLYEINRNVGTISLLITKKDFSSYLDEFKFQYALIGEKLVDSTKTSTKMSGNWTINFLNDKMEYIRSLD